MSVLNYGYHRECNILIMVATILIMAPILIVVDNILIAADVFGRPKTH